MAWDTVSPAPAPTLKASAWWRRPLVRSLAGRLTLAFLLIGLLGAVLVAVLVAARTRSEFDRFLSERDEAWVAEAFGRYYGERGSWEGLAEMLRETPQLDFFSRGAALVDGEGVVVLGNRSYSSGEQVPASALAGGTAVIVDGTNVGTLLFPSLPPRPGVYPGSFPPDVMFLRRVTWASTLSALIAVLLALVLGGLLARTLTRPIRELTSATRAMARGQLDQRVEVRSRDEIGELATAFNQMSADLARASQLRRQMTADLAHDLRTPLTILRGYTEGLKDGRLAGTPSVYALMHDEVEHLGRLIDDLRTLSLADAGELSLNRRAVDPLALLERTALAHIVQAEQHGVGLRVAANGELPSILVDTDRMTQVLNNLVSNALRYTRQGEIVLAATVEGEHVVLSVRDTGTGIAAADMPFIFHRFYRADKARQRTDSNASGLGLAIVKAIVEAHGGAIVAESRPGAGATFMIKLPKA